jgi:hypothetical protein
MLMSVGDRWKDGRKESPNTEFGVQTKWLQRPGRCKGGKADSGASKWEVHLSKEGVAKGAVALASVCFATWEYTCGITRASVFAKRKQIHLSYKNILIL